MSYGNVLPQLTRSMLDRGFPPAYWTYSTKTDVETAIRDGVYGITNNDAVAAGALPEKLTFGELAPVKKSEFLSEEFTETRGALYAYRDAGEYAEVILRAETGKWSLLSDVVRVEYASEENSASSSEDGGCGSFVGLPFACAAAAGLVLVLKRRRG